jgi:hypothetical protein
MVVHSVIPACRKWRLGDDQDSSPMQAKNVSKTPNSTSKLGEVGHWRITSEAELRQKHKTLTEKITKASRPRSMV